jgi:exodeoxyribonuclease VII small subunit
VKKQRKISVLFAELEQAVTEMEKDSLSLEDSFEYYKKGMDLTKECYEKLKQVEENIQLVTRDNGSIEEKEMSQATKTKAVAEPVDIPQEKTDISEADNQTGDTGDENKTDNRKNRPADDHTLPGLFSL